VRPSHVIFRFSSSRALFPDECPSFCFFWFFSFLFIYLFLCECVEVFLLFLWFFYSGFSLQMLMYPYFLVGSSYLCIVFFLFPLFFFLMLVSSSFLQVLQNPPFGPSPPVVDPSVLKLMLSRLVSISPGVPFFPVPMTSLLQRS